MTPFCSAVLVSPDVAVVATRCTDQVRLEHISLGFGSEADVPPVASVVVLDADPRVSAIVLEGPVGGVEPATLEVARAAEQVRSISRLYVVKGEPRESWVWEGKVLDRDDALLWVAPSSKPGPNCHGDAGAPITNQRGSLVGLSITGAFDGASCLARVGAVAVSAFDDVFDEALTYAGW